MQDNYPWLIYQLWFWPKEEWPHTAHIYTYLIVFHICNQSLLASPCRRTYSLRGWCLWLKCTHVQAETCFWRSLGLTFQGAPRLLRARGDKKFRFSTTKHNWTSKVGGVCLRGRLLANMHEYKNDLYVGDASCVTILVHKTWYLVFDYVKCCYHPTLLTIDFELFDD